jgi:hypothetical protein
VPQPRRPRFESSSSWRPRISLALMSMIKWRGYWFNFRGVLKISRYHQCLVSNSTLSETRTSRFDVFTAIKIQVAVFWILTVSYHVTVWHHNPDDHNLKEIHFKSIVPGISGCEG